jgi:hypothetical protein
MIFFVVLMTLWACQPPPAWQVTHRHDSVHLSSPLYDRVNELSVEMVCLQDQVVTYLEVHTHAIPPYQGDAGKARITLKTDKQTFSGIGKRHTGGQRVSLPETLQQILLESLRQNSPVTILLEGYSTTLDASSFAKYYKALKSKPLKLPIKLYG